jgi:hypothetical protein
MIFGDRFYAVDPNQSSGWIPLLGRLIFLRRSPQDTSALKGYGCRKLVRVMEYTDNNFPAVVCMTKGVG